ncbi:phage/plasmid replication domain-containing protein [Zobellella aerophila]|uniref:Replication-associated protein G2P n=1 Tax=Zobellella aerophila TaxID=870480 RepID=A0ABP6WMX7_9GAMM
MYFFDWLSIKQTHIMPEGRTLPLVCKLFSSHLDYETGEEFETKSRTRIEGSYSTSISIRCDGHTVEMSGNPSRFDRLDNLFGLASLDDCVTVYNRILSDCGLPPFTPATSIKPLRVGRHCPAYAVGYDLPAENEVIAHTGAVIQEIHVTRNYQVGQGNESKFYRAMASFKHNRRLPKLYQHGVTWGEGSRRLYFGFYSKGAEFDLPRVKSRLAVLLRDGKINQDELDYYERVKQYALHHGVVRLEYKLKNNWLRDKDLRFYRTGLTAGRVADDYLIIAEKWVDSMSVSKVSYDNIGQQLVSYEVCGERAARVTESVFLRWLHGMDLGLGDSQFYVHKKRLLALGIDISMPCDVTSLRVHIRTDEIMLSSLAVPDWYRLAA